jgi:hypothetical protein
MDDSLIADKASAILSGLWCADLRAGAQASPLPAGHTMERSSHE